MVFGEHIQIIAALEVFTILEGVAGKVELYIR